NFCKYLIESFFFTVHLISPIHLGNNLIRFVLHTFCVRSSSQVFRIDTHAIIATVKNKKVVFYLSEHFFISPPVYLFVSTFVHHPRTSFSIWFVRTNNKIPI